MKLLIAGSRDFNNFPLLEENVKFFTKNFDNSEIEIVSGNAKGADKLGEQYAKKYNIKIKLFPADWNKFKKSAGMIRNREMGDYATHAILFWDGKSPGTKAMAQILKEKNIPHKIIPII